MFSYIVRKHKNVLELGGGYDKIKTICKIHGLCDFVTKIGVKNMDLSIVIINHNTRQLTKQTVESILDTKPQFIYEIIVVDNSDKEEEQYKSDNPFVKVLGHVENKGFAHGCNIGAAIARGDYLLFLNSDTIMQKNTLDASVLYMKQNSDVGGLGVQVVLADGQLDHACRRGFPTPWNAFCYFAHIDRLFPNIPVFNGYRLSHLDRSKTYDVDAVTGAYLMMPAELYKKLGGFDETFFMYGEDLDLCWKIKAAGYRVVYYAPVTCVHLKGKSGRSSGNPLVQYHFYNAMLIFYERYYDKQYPRWLTGIIIWVIRSKMPKIEGARHD